MNRSCLWSTVCFTVLLLGPTTVSAEAPRTSTTGAGAVLALPPGMTVYYCTSKLAGVFPKVGPICHASVVFCPQGQWPAICQDGKWVSNPRCIYFGTQPFMRGFLRETKQRIGVTCYHISTPPIVVLRRVKAYDRLWRPFWNNCMHAAHWATCR
jgi:hypothetical protein